MKKWVIFITPLVVALNINLANAELYIIANKELSTINKLTKEEISAIYLLKKKHWDDGEEIIPINLPVQSNAREHFSQQIFDSSPEKLGTYWDQMLFKGINPPITQNSEQAVELFVGRMKGAIGYVETKPQSTQVKILQLFSGN